MSPYYGPSQAEITDREIAVRWHREHVMPCTRGHRASWWVKMRNGNVSAFNGGHFTPSDYSLIKCEACGRRWRTKAAYVTTLPDNPPVPGPSPDSVVFGPDKAPPATPEERLLLAIYGRDLDDANEVRGLRDHAVTCTREDHTWCFPYPAQAAPEPDDLTHIQPGEDATMPVWLAEPAVRAAQMEE